MAKPHHLRAGSSLSAPGMSTPAGLGTTVRSSAGATMNIDKPRLPWAGSSSVSAGGDHACGVRDDGSVVCWGWNFFGRFTPPEGRFSSVSAGRQHNCGVRDDRSVECWGLRYRGAGPPEGRFVSVSASDNHACGLMEDGLIACWGNNQHGKARPPRERFSSPK